MTRGFICFKMVAVVVVGVSAGLPMAVGMRSFAGGAGGVGGDEEIEAMRARVLGTRARVGEMGMRRMRRRRKGWKGARCIVVGEMMWNVCLTGFGLGSG